MNTALVEHAVRIPRGAVKAKKVVRPPRRVVNFHKLVQSVAQRYGTQAATSWTRATLGYQAEISETALRSAIASKSLHAIEGVIGPTKLQQAVSKVLVQPLTAAAVAAGKTSARVLTSQGIQATFQATHPNVVTYARQHAAELVRAIPQETKQVIAEVIARGAERGLTVVEQARAIREVVGLPPNWASAPGNLAAELRAGQISAATGRRMSGVLKQQIRSKAAAGAISETFIKKAVAEYSASLVNRRALNIARTETLRAANFGLTESWEQAQAAGVLPAETRRFWLASGPSACPICSRIPGMNPDGRGLKEGFMTPEGVVDYPPAPHPNCGCGIGLGFGGASPAAGAPLSPLPAKKGIGGVGAPPAMRGGVRGPGPLGRGWAGDRPPTGGGAAATPEKREVVAQVLREMNVDESYVVFSQRLGKNRIGGTTVGEYFKGKIKLDPRVGIEQIKLTARHEAQHLKFDIAVRADRALQRDILADYEGLKRDDGVTAYSTLHWKASEQPFSGFTEDLPWHKILPVNETLAEMASQGLAGSPRYKALMKRVEKAYVSGLKKGVQRELPHTPRPPAGLKLVKAKPPTAGEKAALKAYQNGSPSEVASSYHVNRELRAGAELRPVAATLQRNLDSVIAKATTQAPNVVYRAGLWPDRLKVGQVFTDKGFVSTTTEARLARWFDGTPAEIRLPTDQRGVFLKGKVNGVKEYEFLLPRNTKFRVVRVFKEKLILEVVP